MVCCSVEEIAVAMMVSCSTVNGKKSSLQLPTAQERSNLPNPISDNIGNSVRSG